MLHLHTLGRLEARSDGGSLETLLAQPKRMALLAYLVLARPRGFRRRDTLVALFWPDLPERRARNALSQALSFLRRKLRDDVVATRGTEDVGVDRALVTCDAIAFEEAVAEERWRDAMALYGGDLLPGLHVAGSAFDQWLEVERGRLRALAAGAAWALAHAALADGGVAEAEHVARRALRLAPTDEAEARSFIEALARSGGRPAALRFYDMLAELLARELDIEPSPETEALAETIRNGVVPTAPRDDAHPVPAAESVPAVSQAAAPSDIRESAAVPGEPLGERAIEGERWPGALVSRRALVGIVSFLVLGAVFLIARPFVASRAPSAPIRLVVLPFRNLTEDPAQELLTDVLTEQMIDELARLDPEHLAVIAYTSSLHYKGSGASVDRIGAELDVDYVLEGSLRREGSHVRIDTRLIAVRDQTPIWTGDLDRELPDILELQTDVARSVARRLKLTLLPSVQARMAIAPRVDSLAFGAYMEGRSYLFRFTPEDLGEGLRYFRRALQYDSSYAPAYAGIAEVWGLRSSLGFLPPDSANPELARAARKALELDSTRAEAHVALAQLYWNESRWREAEEEIQEALELNPSMGGLHGLYSRLLMGLNMPDSALAEIRRELSLDPLSPGAVTTYGLDLYSLRRYGEAIATLEALVRESRVGPLPHCILWDALTANKLPDKALEEASVCLGSFYGQEVRDTLTRGYREGGYAEAMRRVADLLAKGIDGVYVTPLDPFRAYLYAGKKELALKWLSKAADAHHPLSGVAADPVVNDELDGDVGFREIMRHVGLVK